MIKRMVEIEFLKIKNNSFFWIFFISILILFLGLLFSANKNFFPLKNSFTSEEINTFKYLQFPYVWKILTSIAGWFNHLWALLIIILIGKDYNSGIIKQQLVSGLSRKQFFFSKILFLAIIPLVMILLIICFSVFYGYKYTSPVSFVFLIHNSFYIITYYIQALGYMSFALMVVVFIQSTGISVLIYFGYLIFEGVFRFFLNRNGVGGIDYFLPMKSFSLLTPSPFIRELSDYFPIIISLIISIIFLLLFNYLSLLILKKRDIK